MTVNKVTFNSPDPELQKTKLKDAPLKRQASKLFRTASPLDLKKETILSNTAGKTDQVHTEAPLNASTSTTETSSTHSIKLSESSEDATTESVDQIGQEVINEHKATPTLHMETFIDLFGVKGTNGKTENLNEVKIIYLRMCEFAIASGASPDIMVEQLKQGIKVANDITSPAFKDNKQEYSANDLAALDWFLRAQHAKMGQLYLKGATKIPDPDHHLAQFILQVRGRNRGNETRVKGPYPRESSHQPEHRAQIRGSTINCENGEKICFSSDVKKNLINEGIKEENIHLYDQVALGIDVSGKDGNGNKLTPPGKESGTYLFMLLNEGNTPVVFLKAESNSAAPIEGKYGNKGELAKEKLEHGIHIYKKFVPVSEGGAFPDLKEDKLPSNILNHLKGVKILNGGEKSSLRESYDNLQKTTQFKNDYALPQLKAHLENQLKPDVKLEKGQEEKIKTLLAEIKAVHAKSSDLNQSAYPIIPRSREVIMPTLHEMLQNKTVFAF